MDIPIYQIDAFTDRIFGGNPAAVCPLDDWLPEATMQAIAEENNLAETAFFVPDGNGWAIRWFTPVAEVDLAGHPTLATAFVIFETIAPDRAEVRFTTRIGDSLTVARGEDGVLWMDFPARPPVARAIGDVAAAIGTEPETVLAARDGLAVLADRAAVAAVEPDMARIAELDCMGLIVTAPGDDCDFVSRFFAPGMGVPEDPVTGSAHCTSIPYWAERLGRTELFARQISERGGEIRCIHRGERVSIGGRAVPYMAGTVRL